MALLNPLSLICHKVRLFNLFVLVFVISKPSSLLTLHTGRIKMRIARIWNEDFGETYGIISANGKKILTKSDFQEQTGIPIPQDVREFISKDWIQDVQINLSKLEFSRNINDF